MRIDQAKYSTSPKARRRQHFGSGRAHKSTLMVALASSVEMTWRGSMDSFYLGQEGSEMSNLWRDQGRPVLSPPTRSGEMEQLGLRVTWLLLLTCLNDGGNHSMENTWQGGLKCGTLFEASHIPTVSLGRLVNQLSAMSKRLKLSDLAKVVAKKAAASASKGVVISEGSETTSGKRALDDGSKGKQERVVRPDRFLSEALGPQASVMASAATAEKILAGVVLPADKEKVDRLTFDQVVTKFLHVVGQGVILGSSLAVCSRDFAEGALNQKAVAESAEMEMVRAQNRAIELEGALAEEKAKGMKLAEDVDARGKVISKLEARVSDLEKSQSLTQGRIIAAFKESDDFLEAVRGSASSYFGDGFDFCKRQLAKQYPDLSVDLEDVEMDQELLAKEEAEAEKRAAEEEAAEVEGVGEAA
ncbi:hypothetical protein Acr_03g0014230 [Actinidia rufa]|uniref:Uncharacterized protein n=1 Tax=Actinidia rufa TaxID=165716 RepID=A0A7J0EFK3_9ERIC|nr:hypothetical protein Acr_03g0014230 [Actinidia rufa]